MAWLTTPEQMAHILQGCEGAGYEDLDLWWRDEYRLAEWWVKQGCPSAHKAAIVAVPSGAGMVAWIGFYDVALWVCMGIGPGEPGTVRSWGAKEPAGTVTLFNARDFGAAPKHGTLVPGSRCAIIEAGRHCRLGRVLTVLRTGGAETVQMLKDGPAVSGRGQRWFPILQRDEAFDWFWDQGQTVWKHYLVMRTALFRKQRTLTGAAPAVGVKKNPVPGLPHREAPDVQSARAQGLPVELSDRCAVLQARLTAAERAVEIATAATLAVEDDTSAEFHALAKAQNEAEAVMQTAWDAWDAANKLWLAELGL